MIKKVITTLNLGILSGITIHDVRDVCEHYNVTIKAFKQGGIIIKSYTVELEGEASNVARVLARFSSKD